MVACETISVKRCSSTHHTNLGGPAGGFQAIACVNLLFEDSVASHLKTLPGELTFSSHTIGGFYLVLCSFCKIRRCTAYKFFSGVDDAHAFPLFISPTNNEISYCVARDIYDGFNNVTKTGAKATGFEIDGSNNVIVRNCLAERVIANNPEDKQSAGFTNGLCTNVQFINCISQDNKCCGEGEGMGFGWAADPRSVFIGTANDTKWINCVARRNDIGFNLFNQQNGYLVTCTSKENRKYGVFNGPDITVSCHPATECNPPITTIVPNQSLDNVIQINVFCNNGLKNILDTQPTANNVYSQNKSCPRPSSS